VLWDARRLADVHREIRRPTFARLERPLHEVCRYIPFSTLEDALERYGDAIRYMRADFIGKARHDAEEVAPMRATLVLKSRSEMMPTPMAPGLVQRTSRARHSSNARASSFLPSESRRVM
jgi:hypothetical protein